MTRRTEDSERIKTLLGGQQRFGQPDLAGILERLRRALVQREQVVSALVGLLAFKLGDSPGACVLVPREIMDNAHKQWSVQVTLVAPPEEGGIEKVRLSLTPRPGAETPDEGGEDASADDEAPE